jgi:hypothetical protein
MKQRRAPSFLFGMIVSSSLVVFLVESLLSEWDLRPSSSSAAFLLAVAHIVIVVLCGLAITLMLWSWSGVGTSVSLVLFAVVSAFGWIWVPTIVLLSLHGSMGAVPVAAIAAVAMSSGIRKVLPSPSDSTSATPQSNSGEPRELFGAFLETDPQEMYGWIIAACLYGGLFAVHWHSLYIGSFLGALGAFLLTWQLTSGVASTRGDKRDRRHGVSRLAKAAPMAVVITAGLLLSGFQRKTSPDGVNLSARASGPAARQAVRQKRGVAKSFPDVAGYHRIILWPAVEKKNVVAPLLSKSPLSGLNTSKPLVIRFDGSYWYFQPRGERPRTKAHLEKGSPLNVDVRSANYIPLVMEAHQSLAAAVTLTCCREIRVTVENNDNAPGVISLGVLLTDSTSLGKPTLYLDQEIIVSTEPGQFSIKSSPVTEVLSFALTTGPRIQRFDEVTVIFFPDTERPNKGAKIAIQQFELIPR